MPISWTDDAVAAQRSAAIRPFPKHSAYRLRELLGTLLRLTWCGILPLMGKIQLALRKYAGTDDAMDALFRFGHPLSGARSRRTSPLRDILDADQAEYAQNRTEDQQRFLALDANLKLTASACNGVSALAMAWREIPILKAAELTARTTKLKAERDRLEREAAAVKADAETTPAVRLVP